MSLAPQDYATLQRMMAQRNQRAMGQTTQDDDEYEYEYEYTDDEDDNGGQAQAPPAPAPQPQVQAAPIPRTRAIATRGAAAKKTTAAKPRGRPKKQTTAATNAPLGGPRSKIERKLEYLQACASNDPTIYKQDSRRKKGYRQWCNEQYGAGYDGKTFNLKDKTVNGRKLFQSTIVKQAYSMIKDKYPELKGTKGNTLRLKIISAAMKRFEPVYKSPHFQTQIQSERNANIMVKDFAVELQKQLTSISRKR